MGASAVLLIGAAVSAYSAVSAGNAAAARSKTAANIQEYNASVGRQNAKTAVNTAAGDAADIQRRNRYTLSQQSASLDQAGLGGSATSMDVIGDSAKNLEMSVLKTRYKGALQSADFLNGAQASDMQSGAYNQLADDQTTAGYTAAAGSILGAAGGYYKNQAATNTALGPTTDSTRGAYQGNGMYAND